MPASNRPPATPPRRYPNLRRRSPFVLMVLLLLLACLALGSSAAFALAPARSTGSARAAAIAALESVDPVPANLQFAAEVYLEKCSACHLALPPEVLPSESWRQILTNPQDHYSVSLDLITPEILSIWGYLRDFSRAIADGEAEPYRVADSRFFKALHPRVEFPETPSPRNCATCHSRAAEFDFRSLRPEWLDAP